MQTLNAESTERERNREAMPTLAAWYPQWAIFGKPAYVRLEEGERVFERGGKAGLVMTNMIRGETIEQRIYGLIVERSRSIAEIRLASGLSARVCHSALMRLQRRHLITRNGVWTALDPAKPYPRTDFAPYARHMVKTRAA